MDVSRKLLRVEEIVAELDSPSLLGTSDFESRDTEMADSSLPIRREGGRERESKIAKVHVRACVCVGGGGKCSQSHFVNSRGTEDPSIDRTDLEISEQCAPETVDEWSISDRTPNFEQFLANPCVNVYIDDHSDILKLLTPQLHITSFNCSLSSQIFIIGRMRTNGKCASNPWNGKILPPQKLQKF
jgi:hypothetical protein